MRAQEEGDAVTTGEPQMMAADSRGAVDLTAHGADAPSMKSEEPAPTGLNLPLVVVGTEENFHSVMTTSQSLPVVIVMWSGRSLESKPLVGAVEELARDYGGAFQVVTIDVDAAPQIVQAFQIQGVPAVVALIGGRPLPLFQGSAAKDQIKQIIDQVLEAARSMGVTGRIAVTAEQTQAPTPPEHEAPLACEADGDIEGAITAWTKVIDLNPRDEAAKSHLARLRLAARASADDQSDPAAVADALFERGQHTQAFTILLDIIRDATTPEERDSARLRLLDLFRVAGNTPDVMKARMVLSTLVLV